MKKTLLPLFLLPSLLLCADSAKLHNLSMDAMDWDIDSVVYWRWIGKSLHNLASGGYVSSRTEEVPQPFCAQITLTPGEKLNRGSSGASLVLRGSGGKAWHATLSDDGNQRTFHLTLCSGNKPLRVNTVTETGKEFRWNYKIPYVLTLSLDHGRAVGSVADPTGTLLCKISADAGSAGNFPVRAAVHAGSFRCAFSTPKVSHIEARKEETRLPPQTFTAADRYISPRNVSRNFSAKGSGFFRIEKAPSGQFWFIDPLGKAVFLCGVDNLTYAGRPCEALGYSPYLRNVRRIFGNSRARWGEHTLRLLSDWGFNYSGTCERIFRTKLPFSFNLMIGSSFAAFGDEYDLTPYRGRVGTAMPNPFHPRFGEWSRRRFLEQVGTEISNPYFVGYFCDNELQWLGSSRNPDGSGLFDNALGKRSGHSAKNALVKFLATHYQNRIDAFNREWKLQLHSFDEISAMRKLPHRTPEQLLVKQEFLSHVAETYFSTIRKAIQEIDPNHLFLGCRFAGVSSNHKRIWQAAGKYCDAVSFNQYPIADLDRRQLWIDDRDLSEAFEQVYRWSRRPLMITEWAFLGLDSGLPCQYGAGHRLDTQKERAEAAELFLRTTMTMPYMVGLNWYKHGDDPKLGIRRNFPENSNYGLVNVKNEPYQELTSMFRRVHADIDKARRIKPEKRPFPSKGVLYQSLSAAPAEKKQVVQSPLRLSRSGIGNRDIMLRYEEGTPRIGYFRGTEKIGEITFLLRYQKKNGKNDWVYLSRFSDFKTKRLAESAELSLTGSGRTEDGIFRFSLRFLLPEKGSYGIAEVLSVQHEGHHPLRVRGIYFSVFPAFSPEIRDNPPQVGLNLYRKWSAWHRRDGFWLGAASGITRVHFCFYRSSNGVLHPDGYHPLVRTLRPGETWKMPQPCYVFVFSGNGDPDTYAKQLIAQDVRAESAEKKPAK